MRKPVRFCNPTGKNDEEINDPTAHLACYKMKGGANPKREVLVRNQFGDQTVTVNKAESLCVPAEKNGVPSDLALNHFQCYRVRGKGFTSRDVTLSDQFGTAGVTVLKPRRLCAPVDKNGEGIVDEAGHLMCYRIKQPGDSPKRDLTVDDQFGSFTPSVRRPVFLCVPSLKNPAATTTTTSSTSSTSIEASTSTSSTSTTSTTSPLCGNSMPDPGEQCDPPGSLTCPPTSPGGAFTECAADCSCPGVPTTTTTSSTSTTSTTPPLCGNSMPDPGEQCDPPGSLTCPPTSPGGAFTECAADCSCPGVPTTTSTSSTTSTTEVVPSTTSSTVEPSTTTSTTLEPTTTSTIVTTTTSTSSTSTTLALCCGPERITLTSTVGTLAVDNLAPFAFPSGVTTTLDTSAASGGAECVHDVIVPGGGFSVPNFDIPALNYCSSVTPNGCESGTGQGAGRLWDGNGTPGVALTDVTASADTADGVCDTTVVTQGTCTGGANNGNPCVQPPDCPGGTCTGASGCTTAPSGAGGNTLGDIDRTVVASPGGGVRSLIDIPVHSLTWSDSVCSPAITPGCCPTSTYNPGDGDLVITEFDFVLRPSTGTATGLFADKNGNLCKRAGSGFSNPTPERPTEPDRCRRDRPVLRPGSGHDGGIGGHRLQRRRATLRPGIQEHHSKHRRIVRLPRHRDLHRDDRRLPAMSA